MTKSDVKSKTPELPNDGERMVPAHDKGTAAYGDHIARYSAVADLLKEKTVLDIASGSGYGSQIIAKYAQKVYGVDIEKKAVEYAKKFYSAKNLEFLVGSGTKIPLDDDSVDAVVSFETIEHIEDSALFVKEVMRVLRPDGVAIISTPNDLEFPEGNHFHVHEYTYEELKKLLGAEFKYIDSYYQGSWYYSAVGPESMFKDGWDKDARVIQAAPLKTEKVLFFMMVCSNVPIKTKISPVGVIAEHISAKKIQEKEILTQQHIKNLEDELKGAKDYVAGQTKHIAELEKHVHGSIRDKIARAAKSAKHKIKN